MYRCSCTAESSCQLTSVPLLKKPACPVSRVRANRHNDRWQKGCVQAEGAINRPRSIVAASCAVANDYLQTICCSNRLLSGKFCDAATLLCCVFIHGGAVCDVILAGSVLHTLRCPARNPLLKTRRLGSFTFAMGYTPALKNCLLLWSESYPQIGA